MQKNSDKSIKKDNGNAMLITTILLLVMTVLVGACINISGMQFDLSMLQRNTSNTYYLARSGVEKQVDFVNKAIQTKMADIIEKDIREKYLDQITISKTASINNSAEVNKLSAAKGNSYDLYQNIKYDTVEKKLKLVSNQTPPVTGDTLLRDSVQEALYNFMDKNFLNLPAPHSPTKKFNYQVKSDRAMKDIQTEIVVWAEKIYKDEALNTFETDSFKIISVATSKDTGGNIIDNQKVEAIIKINIPEKIDNEIREKYQWVDNPPEILDSAITCFSDMVVTDNATLTVYGDVRVKGSRKPSAGWPDADESGGLIVSNGGKLYVDKPTNLPGSTSTTAEKDKDTTGNIYCMNNVVTTNGWGTGNYNKKTEINVEGDIIANTVGILDDFYTSGDNQTPFGDADSGDKVRNNSIVVKKNIFVDNDVKIDKWAATKTGESYTTRIQAQGSIFGISDNNDSTGKTSEGKTVTIDPNSSSGVFNEGYATLIQAVQMFVNGQPFITLSGYTSPVKLWESIGEPFKGVDDYPGYIVVGGVSPNVAGDSSYLHPSSKYITQDMIKQDNIEITDIDNSYATAFISANTPSGKVTKESKGILNNVTIAGKFFYNGWEKDMLLPKIPGMPSMANFTVQDNGYGNSQKEYIFTSPKDYYNGIIEKGSEVWVGKPSMYHKFYAPDQADINQYQGLRGYMTAMRSIFYGLSKNEEGDGTTDKYFAPTPLEFEKVVFLDNIKNGMKEVEWTYSNPIETKATTISIDKYYVNEGGTESPYPTLIVNTSGNKLTIKTNPAEAGKNRFRGIIISNGDIEIQGEINIEGAIIIRGKNAESFPGDRKYMMLGEDTYSPGLKISGQLTKVMITQNPDILLEMDFAKRSYLREIMDALKITQYSSKTNVGEILGPYNYPATVVPLDPSKFNPVSYTMGRVLLSKDSVLDIKTNKIDISIKNMKKVN